MKKLAFFVFFLGLTNISFSQRVYFLYIQSENEQPFYLKMQERIYSSASKGYLILPRLRDSIYNFSVGFPGRNISEQQFSVRMNAKDHGYLLRDFKEKGWGLFDLQTMTVQMPKMENHGSIKNQKGPVRRDESPFTLILAKASDDSTLLEKPDLSQLTEEKKDAIAENTRQPEIKIEEKKTEDKKTEENKTGSPVDEKKSEIVIEKPAKPDTLVAPPVAIREDSQPKTEEIKTESQTGLYQRSEVIRRSETFTTEGFGVTFLDAQNDGKTDTINILIPLSKEGLEQAVKESPGEKKFLDIVDTTKQITDEPVKAESNNAQPSVKTNAGNNCSSIADENDFFKLRKKMAGIPEDDNMIREASRSFRTKCFTTEQLKNLSTLFLSDGGKYKFFDAAYEHVSDTENFATLQSELKGEYFINRFKAMLR